MRIIPAIDLHKGACVRLYKGDFDKVQEYSNDPSEVAARFTRLDVADLHVVDLDGAKDGEGSNQAVVRDIISATNLTVQLGGGIRTAEQLQKWLDSGVARCVVGSVAIDDPDTTCAWLERFGGDALVLALDVRYDQSETPILTTHGWTRDSGISLWDCLDNYKSYGIKHVLCTDVSRDGAMAGPNIDLYREILTRYPTLQLQASGGVRNIQDLLELREAGLPAAITGKAMLDGKITTEEISAFQQNA